MASNDELYENRISSIEERDYYKVLGVSVKNLMFIFLVLGVNYIVISLLYHKGPLTLVFINPILAIVAFSPSLFAIAVVRFDALSSFIYNTINDLFFKITPKSNTAYMTEYRKHVNDYIINNLDNKIVVFKINSDDFYNKTDEERKMIFSGFNRFLLSTNRTLVFRPHLLRGNELISYLKNIISVSEFSNIYDVPVITDY